jgi:hypothetical protein
MGVFLKFLFAAHMNEWYENQYSIEEDDDDDALLYYYMND